MANQWGRDSEGRAGGSGGRGFSFFLMLVALALGIAGGYGIARMVPSGDPAGLAQAQQAAADLEVENARLRDQLAAAREAATGATGDTELRDSIARQTEDIATLTEELATAQAAQRDAEASIAQLSDTIDALTAERDALARDASDADGRQSAELARLRDEAERLTAENAALGDDRAAAEARIAALDTEIAGLREALSAARAELDTARAAAETPGDSTPPQDDAATGGDAETAQRDRAAVAQAIAGAPGLDALSDADRQELEDALAGGACVTTALESVIGHVPILALRNLIRDLNSDC